MLATQFIFQPSVYMPTRSSPLTERHTNACPRPYYSEYMSSSKDKDPQKPLPYSKRAIKNVPVAKNKEVKDKRREMFLKKVKSGREEKNWEMRGDQILRMDFLKEQRQWQSEKARSAPDAEQELDDETLYDQDLSELYDQLTPRPQQSSQPMSSFQSEYDERAEAEAILAQEQAELEAALALMEEETLGASEPTRAEPSHFGSDDEDYDGLFMDYLEDGPSTPAGTHAESQQTDAMDTS